MSSQIFATQIAMPGTQQIIKARGARRNISLPHASQGSQDMDRAYVFAKLCSQPPFWTPPGNASSFFKMEDILSV